MDGTPAGFHGQIGRAKYSPPYTKKHRYETCYGYKWSLSRGSSGTEAWALLPVNAKVLTSECGLHHPR